LAEDSARHMRRTKQGTVGLAIGPVRRLAVEAVNLDDDRKIPFAHNSAANRGTV
jgi:hypothetical protein